MTLPVPTLRETRIPAWAVLVVAAAAPFLPALGGAILSFDDARYLDDPTLGTTTRLLERLSWIFASDYFGNYNPLHRVAIWIQLTLWNKDPTCFHLVSIILHAMNVLLVWKLALRLGLSPKAAVWAGVLFALHPTRAEPVSWISAQKDLGSTMFLLLALGAYAPLLAGEGSHRRKAIATTWAFFLGACLWKSQAAVFPLLLMVLDMAWRRPFLAALVEKVPLIVVSGAFAAIALRVAPATEPHGGGWATHVATMLSAVWIYLVRVVWPVGYSASLGGAPPDGLLEPEPLGGIVVVAAVATALAVTVRRGHRREGLLALVWPAACLLPVSNVVPIPAIAADRYLYLALLGPCLAVAPSIETACHIPFRMRRFAFGFAVLACAALTLQHASAFHGDESLWRRSVASEPENPTARRNLALALIAGEPARERGEEALRIIDEPGAPGRDGQDMALARARVLTVLGRGPEAVSELDRAVRLGLATRLHLETALVRAQWLSESGRIVEAHAVLERCIPRCGDDEDRLLLAHAEVSAEARDHASYLAWNAKALERRPFDLVLLFNREVVAKLAGDKAEARRAGARFEQLAPKRPVRSRAAPGR